LSVQVRIAAPIHSATAQQSMEKFAPENKLRDHVADLIARSHPSRAYLIEVMRLTRLVLEKDKLASTYPHVSLYCDWVMHGEIDRHRRVIDLLEQMKRSATMTRRMILRRLASC
jgi:hypothetical protein